MRNLSKVNCNPTRPSPSFSGAQARLDRGSGSIYFSPNKILNVSRFYTMFNISHVSNVSPSNANILRLASIDATGIWFQMQ